DRLARRRDAVRAILAASGEGADAVLVASVSNVTYLTGFTGDSSFLLLTPECALVVSDGRYAEQLAQECPDLEIHIRLVGQSPIEGLGDAVRKLGVRRVAFEAAHLSVSQHLALCSKVPEVSWRGVVLWVERIRLVKDHHEIAAIREAVAFAERAFDRLCKGL